MQLIQASFGDNNIMYRKKIFESDWLRSMQVWLIFNKHIAKTKKL